MAATPDNNGNHLKIYFKQVLLSIVVNRIHKLWMGMYLSVQPHFEGHYTILSVILIYFNLFNLHRYTKK